MYTVAVRELCEFTAKSGDLDLRFTPAPTAEQGMAGHLLVAARRGAGYESEISLSGDYGPLRVRGRADGFDAAAGRLEEIKTFKGRLDRQPASHRALHWAQARIYAWLLCEARGLPGLEVSLVYLDIGSQQETVFTEAMDAAALRAHFEAHCARFLHWAEHELAHRGLRDAQLRTLRFPFDGFRDGQRALAEGVYKAAVHGRCLMAQAPTGIGKTLGTLFPQLKAVPQQRLDKIFYLAAKTSGRQLALDAVRRLQPAEGATVRTLELVAREKACLHPQSACHGESCPLARGFYDRLPAARAEALAPGAEPLLDQARVRELAQQHAVCPYYLSQELVRWADVVVGDYNYYFDLSALLFGLSQLNTWRVALLVDEAHNLVERARRMYSAELQPGLLREARRSPTAREAPRVKKALDQLRRAWIALDKEHAGQAYTVLPTLPAKLLASLQQCSATITDHLAEHPTAVDPALLDFHFDALHFAQLAETLGAYSLVDLTAGNAPGDGVPCIRNLVPAPFLAPRLQGAHTSTLFSATLQPAHYYADLLGLPADHLSLDVDSPFTARQLQVHVARHISTRWQHRQDSLAPIVALMAAQLAARPGNYLAFFSSYAYLEQAAALFAARHPEWPCWMQSRQMREADQRAFLDRFTEDSQGIGFAVLGGAFSEGVDLPGRRLIGAFLSTLGLPQINPVNEQFRARMQGLFGDGYAYTYLFPGLQKVVQAAGRVIRTTEDRGVVHLIDDRYASAEVQRLLPRWWQIAPASSIIALPQA
jgi:DNA excision repair protein ERCC-2